MYIAVHKYIDFEHVYKTIGMKTAERGVLRGGAWNGTAGSRTAWSEWMDAVGSRLARRRVDQCGGE